jgi:hypothetical protein
MLPTCALAVAAVTWMGGVEAAPLLPTGMTISIPAGTNSASSPYRDDVYLNTLNFGTWMYQAAGGQFRGVGSAFVVSGRNSVNAEFGDLDNGSDGNPNPYVTAGILVEGAPLNPATLESTDPLVQDPSIAAALGTISISQGIDGEGPEYVLNLMYGYGMRDNDPLADSAPEVVFFERGINSDIRVRLIVGGTLTAPVLSDPVTLLRSQLWNTGFRIDTVEIGSSQLLGAAGFDFTDFNIVPGTIVLGLQITSINGSGADLDGVISSAVNRSQFVDLDGGSQTPEPGTWALTGLGLAFVAVRWPRK